MAQMTYKEAKMGLVNDSILLVGSFTAAAVVGFAWLGVEGAFYLSAAVSATMFGFLLSRIYGGNKK